MEIEFANKRFHFVETAEWPKSGVPAELVDAVRKRLFTIRNAPDERTLRNWKSLRFEKLVGKRKGYWSIRVNNQWRLIFQLIRDSQGRRIRIHSLADYH